MEGRPDMLLQLSHYVAERSRQQGYPDVEVRVRAVTSLNRRPAQDQIDPSVNLAAHLLLAAGKGALDEVVQIMGEHWREEKKYND